MAAERRTDLAMEARDLWRGAALAGVRSREREVFGFPVTEVEIRDEEASRALGKPEGMYITLDLRAYFTHAPDALERASRALAGELRPLLRGAASVMVAGLGNDAMTPDAIGPRAADHILVTRHLSLPSLAPVSVLTPGVLGRTGLEAAELVRGAVAAAKPDLLIAIDALASRSLDRLCTTVQLSDSGIVPGSGVGNHRRALNRASLGVPVIALGVPTVVDAATLALDLLEEAALAGGTLAGGALAGGDLAGKDAPGAVLPPRGREMMVTPRDIDAQIRELSRIVGYGVTLALQPLRFSELCDLMA